MVDTSTNMELPHSRCNWILSNKLLVGAVPIKDTLPKLLKAGIKHFISLLPKDDEYIDDLPDGVIYSRYGCKSGRAPSKKVALELAKIIRESSVPIYLHCNGGHGRTGCISAIVCGLEFGWDCQKAIRYVEKMRDTRIDTSRNFIPTPETTTQVELVAKILGGTPPDRSDTSWLKKVKADRK